MPNGLYTGLYISLADLYLLRKNTVSIGLQEKLAAADPFHTGYIFFRKYRFEAIFTQ